MSNTSAQIPLESTTRPLMLGITAVFAPNPFPARRRITAGDGILACFILGPWLFLGAGLIGWGTRSEEHVAVSVWLLGVIAGRVGRFGGLGCFV